MSKSGVPILVVLAMMLLPSVALAGNGTGACFSFGGPVLAQSPLGEDGFNVVCLDDVTPEECTDLNLGADSEWESGLTCDLLKVNWDGSCLFDFGGTVGFGCIYLYYEDDPDYSQLICEEKAGGQFFDDPAACGIPTPTMPGFGMAALALLLLGGALALLTMKGSAKTA
jgi:hypothetical protein